MALSHHDPCTHTFSHTYILGTTLTLTGVYRTFSILPHLTVSLQSLQKIGSTLKVAHWREV